MTTEDVVTGVSAFSLDAAHRAVLEAGKPLVYVCPPAAWAVEPLLAGLPPRDGAPATLVIVPEARWTLDFSPVLSRQPHLLPMQVVTGLARADRWLRAGAIRTLAGSVPDLVELLRRSALKLEAVARVVIGWPEHLADAGLQEGLDTLLAEARAAQRLVLTSDERAIEDFLERHARRAPAAWAARIPEQPVGRARYLVVERPRRWWAARAALDVLAPQAAVLWDPYPGAEARWADLLAEPGIRLADLAGEPGEPADLAIATDLPGADGLAWLGTRAREVVVLLAGWQVGYLRRLAQPVEALRVVGPADRARDRWFELRRALRERLAEPDLLAELVALDPLLDEHDPTLVAAALLAQRPMPAAPLPDGVPLWVRIHLNAGRRDQVRPGDVLGVLLHAAGLAKQDVGRIEVHDGFALVEVRAEQAERAVRGLSGQILRGRRIVARLDRR